MEIMEGVKLRNYKGGEKSNQSTFTEKTIVQSLNNYNSITGLRLKKGVKYIYEKKQKKH